MAALVLQQDGTLILASHARSARSVADGLRRFAELVKCPGDFHHYQITDRALWNAAEVGITVERICDFLRRASGDALPPALERRLDSTMSRFGHLRLVREAGAVVLRADDADLLKALLPELGEGVTGEPTADGLGVTVPIVQRGPIKARLARLGWPVRDEAGYDPGAPLAIAWRPEVMLRPYQRAAISAVIGSEQQVASDAGSGLVILPCGAGKTLIGVGATVGLGCHTLVLAPNSSAVRQWLAAFETATDLTADGVGEYDRRRPLSPVTVTTYQQLIARRGAALPHLERLGAHPWGLIIFDEAHLLPADVFRLTAELASRRRLGLTATPVREDGREADLAALIGPPRYVAPWSLLEAQGWIAPVRCTEIRVPLRETTERASQRVVATAPEKWPVVRTLVQRHQHQPTLILGQYLDQLRDLAGRLGAPLLAGETPRDERERLLDRFRAGDERLLILSRVGNAALDLPNARVAIEVSGNFGSRQEEAQRLGRLLRPKPGSDPAAHFYAVVADAPADLRYAERRQRFLVEQGYRYRIVRATGGAASRA